MMTLPSPRDTLLSNADAEATFGRILDGGIADTEIERFLIELSDRAETADEIAGAAKALRARMTPIDSPPGAIDVCGTGGDGHHTLNVSTAVSLVVAAAGVPVAKHGNRAASSKSGAADTLEALGLDMEAAGRTAQRSLSELGICFLFAANHHPAMARIQPIRKRIGRRTIFNLMGPLSNPAGVRSQLIGIARPAYVPIYADAMTQLDTDQTWIVSGDEGLDELSVAGGSEVAKIEGQSFAMSRISPTDAGLPIVPLSAIRGDDARFNAGALSDLLDGTVSGYRHAVLLNAAAALAVAGMGADMRERVVMAAEAIDSSRAKALLEKWIELAR